MKTLIVLLVICAAFFVVSSLDDEEFVLPVKKANPSTISPTNQVEQEQQTMEEIKKIVASSSTQKESNIANSYIVEIFFVSLILIYGVNYFLGKRKNETIANEWMQGAKETLENNFSICRPLEKEDNHTFKVFAAGRIHCSALQSTISLKKRFDLFSLLMDFIWPTYDQLKIDIALDENSMDNFVFGISHKKEAKKFRAKTDIEQITKQRDFSDLSDSLVIYSEFEDLVRDILTPEVCQVLGKQEKDIVSIHISDQAVISQKIKKSIQFVFKLSSNNTSNFLKLSIYFIDLVARTQLSKLDKQKAEKTRKKKEEEQVKETLVQRQEAAQQRKLEKQKKQKEYIESLSPDQQRKMEEKLHKQEMKKKLSKAKQMVVRA